MPSSRSSQRPSTGFRPRANVRKMGAVRRSQLVTTYGVGAMIAIENESFIVAGLDSWNVDEAPEIFERRLARVLGVTSFRLPPAPDPDRGVDGVRIRRFPEFYSCSRCGLLQRFRDFGIRQGQRALCPECVEDLVPSRFVLVCDDGHIEDFPYWKWVHRGQSSGTCNGELRLRMDGGSASLKSVVVSCSCGVPEVSMEGAFRVKALIDLRIRCNGKRPWLRGAEPQDCRRNPRAMQRGSSSAWNPVMRSALSIPPWGEGLNALIERERLFGAPPETVRWHFQQRPHLLRREDATVDDVLAQLRMIQEANDAPIPGPLEAHAALRKEEYDRLCRGNPERHAADRQPFVCERPEGDLDQLREFGLDGSMLVKRLREVRALEGFTRGVPPLEAEPDQRLAELHLSPEIDWLPAVEVNGEGVFLRLDEDRLRKWEAEKGVVERVERMRRNHLAVLQEKPGAGDGRAAISPVSPCFVLLHTLAHVLINEWSLDGGYPASALRERLYAGDRMAGILIYTATSDSAGSLGGIVAQGDPEKLAATMESALSRASWCSNDPLCMESEASGVDSVNMAACHACVLLPETSCEWNNSFMDRVLLVGTPSEQVPGFFMSL
ncbi:DrmB family protein [Lentzea sp. NPDC102401]|uniref:DrmB family protein n=1 Tax=Lentzea sp. NPDC102401 TaxID=3364128 RepID=UPI003815D851